MKFLKEITLKNTALAFAVLSFLGTIVTIIYQYTYFNSYNIDTSVVSMKLDPQSIFIGALAIFVGLIWTASIYLLVSGLIIIFIGRHKFAYIVQDIALIAMGVFSFWALKNNVFFSNPSISKPLLILYVVNSALIIIGKQLMVIWISVSKKVAYKTVYLELVKGYSEREYPISAKKASMLKAIINGMLVASILLLGPTLLATLNIETKNTYAYLEDTEVNGVIELVIGSTTDGYVLKSYNTKTKKYLDSYRIANISEKKIGSIQIEPYRINSL